MGVTNSDKFISVSRMDCGGTAKVTVSLAAVPDISANPADIVLVLDRSGSMEGRPLDNLKLGANTFIDIIDETTDGVRDGEIGGGSRIAVVSFATDAAADTQLITSVAALKEAVDELTAGGRTNHAAAFTEAGELFDPASSNQKILVMFTDGQTTQGADPSPVAQALRDAGAVIYCIGLLGSGGLDIDALNDWATDPDSQHVAVTPDEEELEQLFADLAASISKPGATNIVVDEKIQPDFVITGIPGASKGAVNLMDDRTIQWTIAALGSTSAEEAVLEFNIRHIAADGGVKAVNQSITYADAEGHQVTFPVPQVTVDCGGDVVTEPCPAPRDVTLEGCEDTTSVDVGDTVLEAQGRILQVSATVRNVCPGKRVALAVVLTELDHAGGEHPRGLKTFTIPAHYEPACRDVEVRCIRFVLPEDLNVSGRGECLCCPRKLRVRLISHYIDHDFRCCGEDPAAAES